MTNGILIVLFKVGSLVCPRGHSIDLLIQMGALDPLFCGDHHHLHQARAAQEQLKLGNRRPLGGASPQPELEAPLTKRQLKHRRNKDSKLNKKFKNLEAEIDNLKSQMDSLKDKITKASRSTNARFKRKKIRSMKRDFDKINEKLKEPEKKLESVGPRGPLILHPPNRNKCIEKKISEINKKIRRAKKKKNREALIAKREALKAELNWNPEVRLIDGAFGSAYSKYRIERGTHGSRYIFQ